MLFLNVLIDVFGKKKSGSEKQCKRCENSLSSVIISYFDWQAAMGLVETDERIFFCLKTEIIMS